MSIFLNADEKKSCPPSQGTVDLCEQAGRKAYDKSRTKKYVRNYAKGSVLDRAYERGWFARRKEVTGK